MRSFGTRNMRLSRRSIFVIAAIFVLQMAICPAVCIAGSPDRSADTQATASAESGHAPVNAMPPCHQSQRETPQDVPGNSDPAPACISCSAETPLTYTAEMVSHSPGSLLIVSLPQIDPTPGGTFSTPFEPDRVPPPAPLYLLKSSFLL
jgi:hypothetical protein